MTVKQKISLVKFFPITGIVLNQRETLPQRSTVARVISLETQPHSTHPCTSHPESAVRNVGRNMTMVTCAIRRDFSSCSSGVRSPPSPPDTQDTNASITINTGWYSYNYSNFINIQYHKQFIQ